MSPLTKIFVVLLVITSILEAAATVVFVNQVQPLQASLDAARAAASTANAQAESAQSAQQSAQSQLQSEQQAHASDRKADAQTINDLQQKISDAGVQLAQLQQNNGILSGNLAASNTSLALATATVSKLQTEVTDLTNDKDTLTKNGAEQTQRIAELTNEAETVKAKLDDVTEQLTVASNNEQKLSQVMKDHGMNPDDAINGPGGLGAGASPINGQVSAVQNIAGNMYATLSVGQADGVNKGTQFFVIDNQGSNSVLGTITVDTVYTDNSVGRVRGDAGTISRIQAGDDVKTAQALRGQ